MLLRVPEMSEKISPISATTASAPAWRLITLTPPADGFKPADPSVALLTRPMIAVSSCPMIWVLMAVPRRLATESSSPSMVASGFVSWSSSGAEEGRCRRLLTDVAGVDLDLSMEGFKTDDNVHILALFQCLGRGGHRAGNGLTKEAPKGKKSNERKLHFRRKR